ncbi:MAG: hypothetical protein AB1635_17640 [Acidobacteriota bacterium]
MKQVGKLIVGIALLAAAYVARGEAVYMRGVADALEGLITLQGVVAGEPEGPGPSGVAARVVERVPGLETGLAETLTRRDAVAAYWRAPHEETARLYAGATDAEVLFVAANAAFRAARQAGATGKGAAQQLDAVLQYYAEVLEADPAHADAAWNYEYVARLRDTLAAARPSGRGSPPAAIEQKQGDDLPAGPTLHGVPGAPPPAAREEPFEVIVPMQFGEREAQPEETPGYRIPRKG